MKTLKMSLYLFSVTLTFQVKQSILREQPASQKIIPITRETLETEKNCVIIPRYKSALEGMYNHNYSAADEERKLNELNSKINFLVNSAVPRRKTFVASDIKQWHKNLSCFDYEELTRKLQQICNNEISDALLQSSSQITNELEKLKGLVCNEDDNSLITYNLYNLCVDAINLRTKIFEFILMSIEPKQSNELSEEEASFYLALKSNIDLGGYEHIENEAVIRRFMAFFNIHLIYIDKLSIQLKLINQKFFANMCAAHKLLLERESNREYEARKKMEEKCALLEIEIKTAQKKTQLLNQALVIANQNQASIQNQNQKNEEVSRERLMKINKMRDAAINERFIDTPAGKVLAGAAAFTAALKTAPVILPVLKEAAYGAWNCAKAIPALCLWAIAEFAAKQQEDPSAGE